MSKRTDIERRIQKRSAKKQRELKHKYNEEEYDPDRPLLPWEISRRKRIAEEEAEENRQMALMAVQAEKDRQCIILSLLLNQSMNLLKVSIFNSFNNESI